MHQDVYIYLIVTIVYVFEEFKKKFYKQQTPNDKMTIWFITAVNKMFLVSVSQYCIPDCHI